MSQENILCTDITWIPPHPLNDAVSMRRYWNALAGSTRDHDRYRIHSVIARTDAPVSPGFLGRVQRHWHRQSGYPRTIRRNCSGEIAHVLDHSWADMLAYVPGGARKVVTVHDLIPLRFPGGLTPQQLARFRSRVSNIALADAVIADSAYTKSEVESLIGVPAERIRVVPCGVEMPRESRNHSPLAGVNRRPHDLLVGSIGSTIERKNLEILPEALARCAAETGRSVVLVRVGALLPVALAKELKSALGEDGVIELGYLSDEEVQRFYASIDVVVIPSLYEGFGLPVIEGMAARIPVVCSNATSLPEVGGDVALYFDPHSPEELATVLARVANEGVPQRQIEEGYERAKALSWRSCLEGIYEVYDGVMEARGR